jgi:hypothetical protein
MLLGVCAVPAFAESYSDTGDHWGAAAIEKWSGYEVLQGNGDGTFAPDRDMSVAELATVLVRALGYTETGSASISPSVPDWAGANVRRAVAAGAVTSEETGLTLTRELAAKILAKAFGIAPIAGEPTFSDAAQVSAAYKPYVAAVGKAGLFEGDPSGNFMPNKGFTRAEIMQALDNFVTDIVKEGKAAESGKSIIVNTPGVALTAGTVKGDLIIGQGVGDGNITLTDVKVEGRLVVYGGGGNSIYIKGASDIPNVSVNKTFGASARLAIDGTASVGTVSVVAGSGVAVAGDVAKLEVVPAAEVTSSGEIVAAPAGTSDVEIVSGTIAELDIAAENVAVALDAGATVTSLVVEAAGAEISVAAGATVTEATVAASDVTIEGSGNVTNVTVTEDSTGGVEITVPGAKVSNESGEAVSVGGDKAVEAGKSESVPAATPGNSNSNSSSSSSGPSGPSTPNSTDKGTGDGYQIAISHLAGLTFVVVKPTDATVTGVTVNGTPATKQANSSEYRAVLDGELALSAITVTMTGGN